jgi:CRISPR-associated protein Cas1
VQNLVGLEGSASAAYFSGYTKLFPPSLEFTGRNRRPPRDPVNAILSLSYTMLHYETVREIEVIGLDPTIGFLHQFEYGRESLACDLVEIHRPMVDEFVWELFRERSLTDRDFSYEKERPGCYLKKESRKRFYPWYEAWAKTLRSHITDTVRALARRILDGKDDG